MNRNEFWFTYRYCKCSSLPSSGTRRPDRFELPKSLQMKTSKSKTMNPGEKKNTNQNRNCGEVGWGGWRWGPLTHSRVTRLSWLQVMWNQVQGLTRVGSQLWSTLSGSDKLLRSAYSASPSEFPLTTATKLLLPIIIIRLMLNVIHTLNHCTAAAAAAAMVLSLSLSL